MAAAQYDFSFVHGDTHTFVAEWKDSTGAAINLTGYTAKLQVKIDYDTPALLTLTDSSGIVIDAALGKLTVTFTATQTATLDATTRYVYDLEVRTGAVVTTLLAGCIAVTPEVTT